jgi:O-6-methylguanine DNA methyltransferase
MTDPLLSALRGLAEPAPSTLPDTVVDGWVRLPGPVGDVLVVTSSRGVRYLRPAPESGDVEPVLAGYRERFARPVRPSERVPRGLRPALTGHRGHPDLDLDGVTDFERAVLDATARIPAGQTRPYGWVAREAGRPRAVRAVGTVLARNPVPLLVPCHRVTRGDGALGQYMLGAEAKATLLRGEGTDVAGLEALAAAGTRLRGSDTTGIVCFPTCHHARRISPAHRRDFRTLDAARAAGYRPCRVCRPAVD